MVPTIQIDDRTVEVGLTDAASVTDLIEAVQKDHVPHGMVIGSIYLNGVCWHPDWDADLASLSVDEVTEVRLETLEPSVAAQEGLQDLVEVLDLMEDGIRKASDDLRFGNHARGLLAFADVADLIRNAMQFFALYAEHEQLTDAHPGLKPLIVAEREIAGCLPAFESAQEAQDWALVADIIEYDLGGQIPRLREAREILDQYKSDSHLECVVGVA